MLVKYLLDFLVFFKTKLPTKADWFLAFLICLSVCYSFLSIRTSTLDLPTQTNLHRKWLVDSLSVRILQKTDLFGYSRYFVWHQGLWLMDSREILNIGQKYQLKGQKRPFVFCTTTDSSCRVDSYQLYQRSLGILGIIRVEKIEFVNPYCDLLCRWWQLIHTWQKTIRQVYYKHLCQTFKDLAEFTGLRCQNVFALSVGLTLGGTQDFDLPTKENFRQLGLTHLVAVSGFQVVLLASSLEWLSLKLKFSRQLRIILIAAALFLLIVLVGPEPPVLRSSLSLLLSTLSLQLLGRKLDSLRALVYSGLLLLLFNPWYLLSVSFQLSFLASLGLIVSKQVENLAELWQLHKFKISFFFELATSTLASLTFTLPVIINLSGKTSLLALFSNLLIIPFIPLISYLNILGLLPIIGSAFLYLVTILQMGLLTVIADLAALAPSLYLTPFSWLEIVLYYLGLLCFWQLPRWLSFFWGTKLENLDKTKTEKKIFVAGKAN